jgi:hypothetical protein
MRDAETVKHGAEWGLVEQYPNLVRKKGKGTGIKKNGDGSEGAADAEDTEEETTPA